MKFHNAVAPSPSTSHKSHSSVEGGEPVRATPTALRPQRRSGGGGVARETVQSKEDDLRMQEKREEEELKQRRKVSEAKFLICTGTVNCECFVVKIFSDSLACEKIKRTKMHVQYFNAVQGRLSKNFNAKIYTKNSQFTVAKIHHLLTSV